MYAAQTSSLAPACLSCGACCFSALQTYVRVTGDDLERLADRADELATFDGHRAYMRMVDGHCGALMISALTGLFVCDAYATRPEVCRDLAHGSDACSGEIATKAERPLSALRRARLA